VDSLNCACSADICSFLAIPEFTTLLTNFFTSKFWFAEAHQGIEEKSGRRLFQGILKCYEMIYLNYYYSFKILAHGQQIPSICFHAESREAEEKL